MHRLSFDALGRPALTGLLYRALAGNAQPGRAAITRRRIEQLQAQRTELMKERSVLATDVETARARMKDAARSAADARLDVQIFTENNPAPPEAKAGLFGRRPSRERREWEKQRDGLAALADEEEQQAAEYRAIHAEIEGRLQGIVERSDALNAEYQEQLRLLRGQMAAWVLVQYCGGGSAEAREQLADYRKLLRGELGVAVLLALGEYLDNGAQRALAGLSELATIWDQHPDPLRPVLEALFLLLRDGRMQRREAGLFQREQFSQPGHWNLCRLVRILGGWPADIQGTDDSGFRPTLWALEQVQLTQDPPADWQPQPAAGLAAWSSGADCLVQLMCCLALWQRGEHARIPQAAGLPLSEIRVPERRGEEWPGLYSSLSGRQLPAWPQPLAGQLWSELSCLVLLAARQHAPAGLYRHWLAESYNWPKSPLFWWTMAELQDDPALLRRMEGEVPGLIAVEPASL